MGGHLSGTLNHDRSLPSGFEDSVGRIFNPSLIIDLTRQEGPSVSEKGLSGYPRNQLYANCNDDLVCHTCPMALGGQ